MVTAVEPLAQRVFAALADGAEHLMLIALVDEAAKDVLHRQECMATIVDREAAPGQSELAGRQRVALRLGQAATRPRVSRYLRLFEVVRPAIAPAQAGSDDRAGSTAPESVRIREEVVAALRRNRGVSQR